MIKINSVSKIYDTNKGQFYGLKDVSLEIKKAEIFGIIGLSGAGKSTLLRSINRLEEPNSGEILINDRDILSLSEKELRKERKKIAMIFQDFNLLSQRTVYDNLALPLRLEGMDKNLIDSKVREMLSFVGLSDKLESYPKELSGGQKQRVAIARALIIEPEIILSDESTSALDPKTTRSILRLLKRINEELKITIVVVTHQMEVVRELCHRIAIMDQGEIVEVNSTLELFKNPKTGIAENLIQSSNQAIRDRLDPKLFSGSLIKLSFCENNAHKTIVSDLIRNFDLDLNIISGDITSLNDLNIGHLYLELFPNRNSLEDIVKFLEEKLVKVEVIK